MRLAVVTAAERDHELVADLAAERAWLCEPPVMGVGGFAAADQTGLGGDEPKVLPVAVAPRLGDRQYALVDAAGPTTVRNVRVHRWGHSGRVAGVGTADEAATVLGGPCPHSRFHLFLQIQKWRLLRIITYSDRMIVFRS